MVKPLARRHGDCLRCRLVGSDSWKHHPQRTEQAKDTPVGTQGQTLADVCQLDDSWKLETRRFTIRMVFGASGELTYFFFC